MTEDYLEIQNYIDQMTLHFRIVVALFFLALLCIGYLLFAKGDDE